VKKALIQLHIAIFLAGFTAVIGKILENLNEVLLVWYRLVITVVVLAVIMYFKKELTKISFKDFGRMAKVGAVITFHWVTFYGSILHGNISIALVCLSSAGFFSAIIEPLFFKQKINVVELLLGILTIVGIYIIFDFHPQYKLGIIYGILCAIGSAVFPILNKQLVEEFSPRTLTLYELTAGLLILTFIVPLYLNFAPPSVNAVHYIPTGYEFIWLIILALFCTILCFDLQLQALKKISAFTSNLMYNLEPLYGIIMAFVFFKEGEQLNNSFYVGTFLILAAVGIQMYRISSMAKANKTA
jgi:drug/metabolite transporter (DMT)-like permease